MSTDSQENEAAKGDTSATQAASAVPAKNGSGSFENAREVSAAAVARMMGVATASDVSLLDGKLELLSSKVNTITGKMEKLLAAMNSAPRGSDLERIDVQIGSLKSLLAEALGKISEDVKEEKK